MVEKSHPAKVQTGGRVSLDADVRRELDLEEGDYVLLHIEKMDLDGE